MTELQLLEKRRELLLAEISAIDLRTESIRNAEQAAGQNEDRPVRMLTIKEAASEAGLSYDFVRKLCLRKEIASIKAGTKTLINWPSLENYLKTGGGAN